MGVQMQRLDLIMRDDDVEEIRERGNQAGQESMKMDGDLGGLHVNHGPGGRETAVAFDSLESVARACRTLSNPSRLITVDRSRAGSKPVRNSAVAQAFLCSST